MNAKAKHVSKVESPARSRQTPWERFKHEAGFWMSILAIAVAFANFYFSHGELLKERLAFWDRIYYNSFRAGNIAGEYRQLWPLEGSTEYTDFIHQLAVRNIEKYINRLELKTDFSQLPFVVATWELENDLRETYGQEALDAFNLGHYVASLRVFLNEVPYYERDDYDFFTSGRAEGVVYYGELINYNLKELEFDYTLTVDLISFWSTYDSLELVRCSLENSWSPLQGRWGRELVASCVDSINEAKSMRELP